MTYCLTCTAQRLCRCKPVAPRSTFRCRCTWPEGRPASALPRLYCLTASKAASCTATDRTAYNCTAARIHLRCHKEDFDAAVHGQQVGQRVHCAAVQQVTHQPDFEVLWTQARQKTTATQGSRVSICTCQRVHCATIQQVTKQPNFEVLWTQPRQTTTATQGSRSTLVFCACQQVHCVAVE